MQFILKINKRTKSKLNCDLILRTYNKNGKIKFINLSKFWSIKLENNGKMNQSNSLTLELCSPIKILVYDSKLNKNQMK